MQKWKINFDPFGIMRFKNLPRSAEDNDWLHVQWWCRVSPGHITIQLSIMSFPWLFEINPFMVESHCKQLGCLQTMKIYVSGGSRISRRTGRRHANSPCTYVLIKCVCQNESGGYGVRGVVDRGKGWGSCLCVPHLKSAHLSLMIRQAHWLRRSMSQKVIV